MLTDHSRESEKKKEREEDREEDQMVIYLKVGITILQHLRWKSAVSAKIASTSSFVLSALITSSAPSTHNRTKDARLKLGMTYNPHTSLPSTRFYYVKGLRLRPKLRKLP